MRPVVGRKVEYETHDGNKMTGVIVKNDGDGGHIWIVAWDGQQPIKQEVFIDPDWAPVQLVPNGVEWMVLLV